MEQDVNKLQALLKKAYELLGDCYDSIYEGDRWMSGKGQTIKDEIAEALDIPEKDRV